MNDEIVDYIKLTVGERYGFNLFMFEFGKRKRELIRAKHIAIYLTKLNTNLSCESIGEFYGNLDHASILHAVKSVKNQTEVYKHYRDEVEKLNLTIKNYLKSFVFENRSSDVFMECDFYPELHYEKVNEIAG
jgi:chromosomal replication initiator protein